MRAAPMPRRIVFACSVVALNADTGAMEWHYDSAPGDHLQCDGSTDITLATITIDAAAAQRHPVRAEGRRHSTCSIAPAARRSPSKKLGMGAHNHFAQSFSPKTGLAYVPTTELPASNVDGDAPADAGKSALVAWDPVEAASRYGRCRPRARSAAACSRPPASWSFRVRPMATHCVFRGRRPSRVGVLYRHGGARRAHQLSRSASASTSRYSTDPRRERPVASVRCLPDSVGIHARIRDACSRSCSMARAHCRPRPVPSPRRPWTAAISPSTRRWRKRARSCSRSVSGATALARSPAVVARICGLRCRPWWRPHLRAWCAAETKPGECRNSKNSAIGSSTPCGTTFARGRDALRDPTAWRRPRLTHRRQRRRLSRRSSPHPNRLRVRWNRPALRPHLSEREAGQKPVFHNVLATRKP